YKNRADGEECKTLSSWGKPKGDEEFAELMNQIAYPFVNRRSIQLGLLPRTSFLGTIAVVFRNDAWRAKSMYSADHPPAHRSHAFRDLEEQPAAERNAYGPVDQEIDGHQTSLHAWAATAQLMNPHMARVEPFSSSRKVIRVRAACPAR